MEPRIIRKVNGPVTRICPACKRTQSADEFLDVRHWSFPDKKYVFCNSCLEKKFDQLEWDWEELDKFFQCINIPFVPSEFERLHDINQSAVLPIYVRFFQQLEYESLEWKPYHDKYMELKRKGKLDMELPSVRESYFDDLRLRWGPDYDENGLLYLENLYNGMLLSQNINGGLQTDQAQKLCKISWAIDERIRAGVDFDKMMSSYEKMAKIADFTPKNVRSDSDFSSCGEITAWLEKRGWINLHYDNAKRDVIDELIHSNQAFAQRLYTNESGAAEEIQDRVLQLKIALELDKKDQELGLKSLSDEENLFVIDEANVDLEGRENDLYDDFKIDDDLFAEKTLRV